MAKAQFRRLCIFCEIPRKMREKHIIPQWAEDVLPKQKVGVTKNEHKQFFETKAPLDNWEIYLGCYITSSGKDRKEFGHWGLPAAANLLKQAEVERAKKDAQTTALALGRLHIQSVSSADFKITISGGRPGKLLRKIWPIEHMEITWPFSRQMNIEDYDLCMKSVREQPAG